MSKTATEFRAARNRRENAQRKTRGIIFLVIIIAVLGVAGYYLKIGLFRPAPPELAGNVIDVQAAMNGFDQYEIHVRVGEPVTIRLTSLDNTHHTDGGGKHQWAVDELGVDIVAPALGSASATFTPTEVGTYTFYCDICCGGRANPSMNGTLVVEG